MGGSRWVGKVSKAIKNYYYYYYYYYFILIKKTRWGAGRK